LRVLRGQRSIRSQRKDITWLLPEGTEMTLTDWSEPELATIAFLLDGDAFDPEGAEPEHDASFLVLMNGEKAETTFIVPGLLSKEPWRVVLDTRERSHVGQVVAGGQPVVLDAGSLVVLTDEAAS
jgi:glycogen operon protein